MVEISNVFQVLQQCAQFYMKASSHPLTKSCHICKSLPGTEIGGTCERMRGCKTNNMGRRVVLSRG